MRKLRRWGPVGLLLLALALASCGSGAQAPRDAPPAAVDGY